MVCLCTQLRTIFFGVLVRSVMSLIVYALPLHMAIQTIC